MLLVFVRVIIGATFLGSAALKSIRPRAFVDSLPGFGVPRTFSRAIGLTLVAAEAAVSLTMVVGGSVLVPGLWLAAVLLLGFSAVLLRVLVTGIAMPCHCFGNSSTPASRVDLVRNGGFLVLVAIGLSLAVGVTASLISLPKALLVTASPVQSVIALGAGLGFALIWSQLPEIVRLFTAGTGRSQAPQEN